MCLKNYSLFHIGIKVNLGVNLGEFKPLMKSFAEEEDYKILESEELDMGAILSRGFSPGTEKIAEKDGTRIEFNLTMGAINFIGTNPLKVSDLFKKALTFLEKKGYELNRVIQFFEIIITAYIETDKNPEDVLNGNVKLKIEKASKVGDLQVNAIQFKGNSIGDENYSELSIEINPLKPSSEFIIKMVKRSKDTKEISQFHESFEESIKSLIGI